MFEEKDNHFTKVKYALRDLGVFGIDHASAVDDSEDLNALNEEDLQEIVRAFPKMDGLFNFLIENKNILTTEPESEDHQTHDQKVLSEAIDQNKLISALIFPTEKPISLSSQLDKEIINL